MGTRMRPGGEPQLSPTGRRQRERAKKLLRQIAAMVASTQDPLDRLKLETAVIDALRDEEFRLSDQRRETARECNNEGMSYAFLSEQLGMSRGRVQQLVTEVAKPRRLGVIETDMRVAAAEMRAAGVSDEELVEELVPTFRGVDAKYRTGYVLTVKQIAGMLGVPQTAVRPTVRRLDAEQKRVTRAKAAV